MELIIAPGIPTTIPANINKEIPFPIPRSLICSPTHIRKAVPAVNVITVNALKAHGLNVDITPISATSRIIIQMHSVGGNTSSGRSYFLRLRRKVNNTGDTNVASFQIGDGSNGGMQSMALTHVDYDASSPFNTSHVRNYRIRFGQDGSGTARFDYATTSVLYCLEIQ